MKRFYFFNFSFVFFSTLFCIHFVLATPITQLWQVGTISLAEGAGRLQVPRGYHFIDFQQDSTQATHYQPYWASMGALGILERNADDSTHSYRIFLHYRPIGHVNLAEMEKLEAQDWLAILQDDLKEKQKNIAPLPLPKHAPQEDSLEKAAILGWWLRPTYEGQTYRILWAERLHYQDSLFLRYQVRLLGRYGTLDLQVIAPSESLAFVRSELDKLCYAIQFNEGYRYQDFDPAMDKIAAAGAAGVFASKYLTKAGIFSFSFKWLRWFFLIVVALRNIKANWLKQKNLIRFETLDKILKKI
ncbi:DUF2167 domain-containing protein [Hugenholtzia roseola]|uniref:DUF2167 domain-containing protein n=1 Tax=Hugenholtzia roseola TaxID=1002 RepID=UPI000423E526|nr:DUF2167 domain-containing protein [Hugenholtzia roseola]